MLLAESFKTMLTMALKDFPHFKHLMLLYFLVYHSLGTRFLLQQHSHDGDK
jgi:hypothetical protein